MKTKKTTRVLSALLAMVMVFLLVPMGALSISADSDYTVPTTGHKLLSSYNALTGTDISSGEADIKSALDIFDRDNFSALLNASSSYTGMHAQFGESHEGSDMMSFSNSVGISISSSIGVSVGLEKIFKASASKKFNISADVSYSEAKETFFYEYVVNVQKGYYSFDEKKLDLVKDYSNNYLADSFKNALTGDDGSTPEEFFEKYGTHIITSYTAGGTAGVYSSSIKTEENASVSLSGEYANNVGASGTYKGISAGIDGALDIKAKVEGTYAEKGYHTSADTYAYGGNNAVDFNDTFEFTTWLNSVDETNATVLADKRLRLIPIWELLPDVGYENRALDLTTYFIQQSELDDDAFYTKYGIEDSLFDYSKDWLGFENAKIITNEEQLNDIRNDLRGVYVLANDIVLSDYANWETIGTKDDPFEGRLYGNNNTISGLNISIDEIDSSNDTLIGLFGCNSGLISDVKLEGAISTPTVTSSNVYIASIAAYNDGIVNNCFDNVEYNVGYDSTSYLNLPLISQEVASSNTYTVGNELGIYLKGTAGTTYSNVNIVVEESNNVGPVYIVLEEVNIMGNSANGTIYNPTGRSVYLISKGISNTISGRDGTPGYAAINMPNSNLHVFGDAELNIYGGNGAEGSFPGKHPTEGHDGASGGRGYDGASAVIAQSLNLSIDNISIHGGNGGAGGRGGTGNSKHLMGITTEKANGGTGGTGGNGSYAVDLQTSLTIASKNNVKLCGGKGGNGGVGGTAGDDGKQGYGGTGGKGELAISNDVILECVASNTIVIAGAGGSGGSGRTTGSSGASASLRADMYIGDKRYVLHDTPMTWQNAKAASEANGAYLATITSKEEHELIGQLLSYGAMSDYNIGGYRAIDDQDVWAWVTGETFDYSVWEANQPDNCNGIEDYLEIDKASKGFNDHNSSVLGYIEEYDLTFESEVLNDNILSGVTVGYNTSKGKEINSNQASWKNNLLKIDSVAKTEYYSTSKLFDTVFDETTVTVIKDEIDGEILDFSGSFSTPGISAITVTFGAYERLIPIFVIETVPTSITITTMPKTSYEIWETFDISDLTVTAIYNDGSVKENITLSNSDLKHSTPDMDSLGKKDVEITFFGAKTSYSITVDPKTINGLVEIIGTPEVNNTLSAKIVSISDETAKTNSSYQWLLNGVQQANGDTLFVKESMAGKQITLKVSFYGNYQGVIETTIDIRKKEQSAPATAPVVVSKTNTSVTLEELSGMEYTYCVGNAVEPSDEAIWQPNGNFEGLAPNTLYSFFMRKTANSTSYASASSSATVISTLKTSISGTVTIQGGNKVGETLAAEITNLTENANVLYQWYRDEVAIPGATSATYTLTETDVGTNVYLMISGTNSYIGDIQSNQVEVKSNEISSDTPQIIIPNKTATPGSTIQIPINLSNNTGFAYLRVELEYDESVLTLDRVTNSVSGLVMAQGDNVLSWDSSSSYVGNGELCVLTFVVDADAAIGDYDIDITVSECYDENTDDVELYAISGKLTVIDFVYGDANGDGEVNGKDVIILRRYLVGQAVEIFDGADANGDGEKNGKDVIILRRYLVGTAELGPVS